MAGTRWDCRFRRCCLVCLTFVSAACAVGPDYQRPAVPVTPAFRNEASAAANSGGDLPWWEMFHDPNLQTLIKEALTNDYDLQIALSRVEQARERLIQARSGFFPQVIYQGYVARSKNAIGASIPVPTGQTTSNIWALGVSASWELDLWGRIRRLSESARAQWQASEEARRDVIISVLAQVAEAYFRLLALDRELEIAVAARESFASTLQIFNERLENGVASKLETSSAEALLNTAMAAIPDFQRQIIMQEDILCYLVGRPPGAVTRQGASLDRQGLPKIPAGLPSTLLERRPDIREAEQQLRSANAQIGVAEADFFPRFSLTGLVGQVSFQLSNFFTQGALAWSVAANINNAPLFTGGALTSRYRQAKAARDQFVLQYQATVLRALQEVADSLIARQKFAEVQVFQARAVAAYQQAVKISLERYQVGNASYYEVLQEQQQLFPAERSLVEAQLGQMLAVVQLYRALGGGWDQSAARADR